MTEINFRCVRKNITGQVYILIDDVAKMLNELAATEETDVADRLREQAKNIMDMPKKKNWES